MGCAASAQDDPVLEKEPPVIQLDPQKAFNFTPYDFSFHEILDATKNFTTTCLGEGGFGSVYLGYIKASESQTAIPVAVKRLRKDSVQGYKQWMQEVIVLSRSLHLNLIQLIGFCNRNQESILVYEYCSRSSLDTLLADESKRRNVLSWRMRFKIALQCAAGLSFLHQKHYIHRDFKSANILLTDDYTVKISDFGLCRAGPEGGSEHVSTRVFGTPGYIDPEYMITGKLSFFSDMYAFGVVLLELLTGRRPFVFEDANEMRVHLCESLADEMRPILGQQPIPIKCFMDPSLEGRYDRKCALSLATIAKHCITSSYAEKISMEVVYKELKILSDFSVVCVKSGIVSGAII